MATANQQVVYAMATPPHGVVQYEYYTHQMPQQSTTAYATSVPVQYGGSVPPPPPGAAAAAAAAEQNGDAAAKRAAEEGTQSLLANFCFGDSNVGATRDSSCLIRLIGSPNAL